MSDRPTFDVLPPLDDEPGPALPLSDARALVLVRGAIARRAALPPSLEPATPGAGVGVAKAGSRRIAWLSAAACLTGLAAAGAWAATGPASYPFERTHFAPPPGPAPVMVTATVEAAPPPPPAIVEPVKAVLPVVRMVAAAPLPTEDLLRTANMLRGQRHWLQATQTYERVLLDAPSSPEAYAARTAAASLHLEHLGNPRRALTLYRAALAEQPDGALSEEARWGIAECWHALGDKGAEIEALQAFLGAHPESAMRPRAEDRLAELRSARR